MGLVQRSKSQGEIANAVSWGMIRSGFTVWLFSFYTLLTGAELSSPQPLFTPDRQVFKELTGVWRQTGYGRLIAIHDNGYDLYHATSLLCYRDPTGANLSLDNRYSFYEFDEGRDNLTLYFHDLGENTTRFQNFERFTRLSELPAECADSLNDPKYRDPRFVFDLFWQTFQEEYAFFERRQMDWAAIRTMYRPRVRPDMSPEDLFAMFKEILEPLNDGHVHLYLGTQQHFQAGDNVVSQRLREAFAVQSEVKEYGAYVSRWANGLKETVANGLLEEPVHRAANGQIWWGSLNDRIGYINVYLLTNFIPDGGWTSRADQLELLDETFDEIFAAFAEKSAILLDLSHNQGGFDAASDLIASRFADRARHVLTIQPLGVSLDKSERVIVTPSSRSRFIKPVYVLTSPVTVSAGEGLTAMLKAFPHVTHVGETTRGYLSGILNKPLPADLAISVSNQRILSPDGFSFEVEGVYPDVPINLFAEGDLHSSYRTALDETIALMMNDLR